jgi:chromosome segregation ATPase
MDLSKFDILESKVTSLLSRVQDADYKYKTLENELEDARNQIRELTEERSLILSKIDELLSRLDSLG